MKPRNVGPSRPLPSSDAWREWRPKPDSGVPKIVDFHGRQFSKPPFRPLIIVLGLSSSLMLACDVRRQTPSDYHQAFDRGL
ncbi:hypothetical protein VTN02DRAFT_5258 [Thermoascus thermophilus]